MATAARVHYGQRTLGDIDLNGTIVKDSIDVSEEITIFLSICKEVETTKSITALCSTILSLDATSIAIAACQVDDLRAIRAITAIACRKLGIVRTSSGTVALIDVKSVSRVYGKDILLDHTVVVDDVIATRNIDISDSTIGGTLICAPDRPLVVIKNCTINKIIFNLKPFKKFDVHTKISRSPIPLLKLVNCRVRDIVFQGGVGKVMLLNKSVITGKVSIIKR